MKKIDNNEKIIIFFILDRQKVSRLLSDKESTEIFKNVDNLVDKCITPLFLNAFCLKKSLKKRFSTKKRRADLIGLPFKNLLKISRF